MSTPSNPVPVSIAPDNRPTEVVIVSHSPLFYWWPVWAVGFIMAALSYWQGYQMALVPLGTVARNEALVEGVGKRDILIAPEGQSLPAKFDSEELQQPRLRMAISNNPGIIWVVTLFLVLIVTHVQLRGVWSLVVLLLVGGLTVLFAILGLWDPILRSARFLDVHINAFGYLLISTVLLVLWLLMFFVFDQLKYMIFTRGRVRVRKLIGEGEKVFDTRGMVFKRHRDDMFRHWLLGLGTADLTVFTSGANSQQIEMPNVLGIGRKLALINTMLQELEVTPGR